MTDDQKIAALREALEEISTRMPGSIMSRIAIDALAATAPAAIQPAGDGYVLALETVVPMPDGKNELGYTLLSGVGIFSAESEVHAAIQELSLPLGWVSMKVVQLLPGWMMPAAPVPEAKAEQAEPRCIKAGGHCNCNPHERSRCPTPAAPAVKHEASDLPPLPDHLDITESIALSSIDSVEFAELMGAHAATPSMDTAWAVLQYADKRMHAIVARRFELARQSAPIAVPAIADWHDGSAPVDWTPEKVAELHAVLAEYPPEPRKVAVQGSIEVDEAAERVAFERHEHASELTRNPAGSHDDYQNPCVESAWQGWLARAYIDARSPVAAPDSARDAALEEAALVCRNAANKYEERGLHSGPQWTLAVWLEREIRALKATAAPDIKGTTP